MKFTRTLGPGETNETPRLVAGALSNHYDNGNRANCTITNATFEFIKSLAKDGDIQQVNNTPHLPAKLLNISLAFQPVTVGEEFLRLGDKHYLELLGKKLVSREPIKIVWFGGSNTEGRSPQILLSSKCRMWSTYSIYYFIRTTT